MKRRDRAWPPLGRVVLAFVAAPAVPILLMVVGLGAIGLFVGAARPTMLAIAALAGIYGVLVGYGLTLLVAVPLYLVLRVRGRLTREIAGASGALIGALPPVVLVLLSYGKPEGAARLDLSGVVAFAGFGLLAGLTFWKVHEGGGGATPHPSGFA